MRVGGTCAAHLALMGGAGAGELFPATSHSHVVQTRPWGRLEQVADGVWALISTPLEDGTTLCNGGIVAGQAGTAVIEAFATPEGATWMAERARALTGRWPDHVVVTHHHGDHTRGVEGYQSDSAGPAIWVTDATRAATGEALQVALAEARILPERPTTLDLGGRILRLVPRSGHTASDVVVALDDPSVVFCGDLVWNGMFPNYVDARPSALSAAVAALERPGADTVYVPGHGVLADRDALTRYRAVLDHVEAVAREAVARGRSAAEAADGFALPPSLGEWYRFSASYPARALAAWMRELEGV